MRIATRFPEFVLPVFSNHRVRRLTMILLCLLAAAGPASAAGSGGVNAAQHRGKPHLVLISIDGFGWNFQDRFDTPVLDAMAADGVRAAGLVPVFPTLTFPNHYSIATGLYPVRHGLVGNRFRSADGERWYSLGDRSAVEDGSWYRGEPIWVTAEKNGMVSAAFFFVGTEAAIGGYRPTYWNAYNESVPGEQRVDQVLEWLAMPADRRPHLVTLYFDDVDTATHRSGIASPPSIESIGRVEGYLERLRSGIAELPVADDVYLVVVSDHGLAAYRPGVTPFAIDEVVNLDGIKSVDHGAVSFLYFDTPDPARASAICELINEVWRHGQAVAPDGAPSSWHLGDGAGFADVIVQADPRYAVMSSRSHARQFSMGDHGWSPEFRDMHGMFLATGPGLPKGRRIGRIDAVDVYPLMLEILGLPAPGPIDGDGGDLIPLLSGN
jgi:predicted AlkP superfamily pyrophosphatase or phosphodiesterase